MYGTTMKNYNVNKASKDNGSKRNGNFFARSIGSSNNNVKIHKKTEDTRYISIDEMSETAQVQAVKPVASFEGFSKKDFPIASVIVTIVLTMMVLLVASVTFGI